MPVGMNYGEIAAMASNIGKDMAKLNNRLDAVIDKTNEVIITDDDKKQAIELIEQGKWEEASVFCKDKAKDQDKLDKLNAEEKDIRAKLEVYRLQLDKTAKGEVEAVKAERNATPGED
jgi:seryl-tRNA synthetase